MERMLTLPDEPDKRPTMMSRFLVLQHTAAESMLEDCLAKELKFMMELRIEDMLTNPFEEWPKC